MRTAKIVAALALAVSLLGGCATDPATGTSHLNVWSDAEEVQLGNKAGPEFLQSYGGPIPDATVTRYVSEVGMALARVSERSDLPWEFHAVDSGVINAFALPGGKVFITRALLEKLQSEAALAGVLGHEVGHVTAQHSESRVGQALIVQAVATGIGIAGEASDKDWLRVMGVGAQAGGTVYLLKYNRDQESQSDMLGLRYMTKLGYNPVGLLSVMKVLKEASGGGGGVEWMSTHPLPDTRIRRIEGLIKDKYPGYDQDGQYRWDFEDYQNNVLNRLKKLPPPKHKG